MESNVRWDCVLKGIERFLGIVTVILLISLGIELLALQNQDEAKFAGTLLILFIAPWIGAFGIASLALIPVWLFVRARTACR